MYNVPTVTSVCYRPEVRSTKSPAAADFLMRKMLKLIPLPVSPLTLTCPKPNRAPRE